MKKAFLVSDRYPCGTAVLLSCTYVLYRLMDDESSVKLVPANTLFGRSKGYCGDFSLWVDNDAWSRLHQSPIRRL